jgi:lysophospholipase L1-like esterase
MVAGPRALSSSLPKAAAIFPAKYSTTGCLPLRPQAILQETLLKSFTKSIKAGVAVAVCAVLAPLTFATPAVADASTSPTVAVAFGDSLTQGGAAGGRDFFGRPIDDINGSWSTGSDPRSSSHRLRLEGLLGKPIQAYNLSVGGSTASDIARQAQSTPSNASYVTILTGGNDICNAGSIATLPNPTVYRQQVAAGIAEVRKHAPGARILLASIPRVTSFYTLGKTSAAAKKIHQSNRYCPIALGTVATETQEQANTRRAAVDARTKALNAELVTLAAATPGVTSDQGAAYNTVFTLADLSTADYFHPSYTGQAKIAQATWEVVLSSGMLTTPVPGAPAEPGPTTATGSVALVSPSTMTEAGSLIIAIESSIPVESVYASAANGTVVLPMQPSGTPGHYASQVLDVPNLTEGVHDVLFTIRLSDGTGASFNYPITIAR